MNARLPILLLWCIVGAATCCRSQNSATHQTVFSGGLGAQVGVGYLAIRDEHISEEKYAGSSVCGAVQWSRFHETFGYRIWMNYLKASEIKNNNISAEVTQGTFDLVYLYPAWKWDVFGKELFAYLGPSTEAFMYYRKQNIALNPDANPDIYQSGAWLLSLGARIEVVLPLKGGFDLESALQVSLLSLGGGTGNTANSSTPITLLTVFAALRGTWDIGLRYSLLTSFSIATGYRLEVTRISSWNDILSGTDNVYASLGYHF